MNAGIIPWMRYSAWALIVLDLLTISFWFVTGALVAHHEPQNLHELTIGAFHVVAAPAILFLAAEHLWHFEKIGKSDEDDEENLTEDSMVDRFITPARSKLFAWIVLFTLLLLPDILVLLKEEYSSDIENHDLKHAALGVAIAFVIMSGIAWIWMIISVLVLSTNMYTSTKGLNLFKVFKSGSSVQGRYQTPSSLTRRKTADSPPAHSW